MNLSPERLLEAKAIGLRYPDGLQALENVTFSLHKGEFVALIGPSGSGKSTLLRLLAGLLQPTAGTLIFHSDAPRIGMVFQDANLMPWRSVLENISLPLELAGMAPETARQQARAMIRLVGLEGFEAALPADLSGGMAQRVAIARALIHKPDLLLLDEPFASLDALTREQMWEELLHIWEQKRTTVLMVTHSISEALFLSDRVLVLSPRPGHIRRSVSVPFPRPRQEEIRYTADFGTLSRELKNAIAHERQ